ncbi:aquaporin [Streptomyces massasporeus]|uniref:aquaporin n=1 Tax=Streptomyces massasporeus TaxID=67324 RepID=UPI003F4CBEAB
MVGSGIQATELTHDVGVQLRANSLATVFGLGVLITLFGPVSGAHFNPVVTLAAWFTGRRTPDGLTLRDLAVYLPAQIAGAVGGAVLADAMFAGPLVQWSTHDRSAGHLRPGELVATAGLALLILGLTPHRPGPCRSPRRGVLHRRGVLVRVLHLVRQPRGHRRPSLHRHLRRDRPRLCRTVHRGPTGGRRAGAGAGARRLRPPGTRTGRPRRHAGRIPPGRPHPSLTRLLRRKPHPP